MLFRNFFDSFFDKCTTKLSIERWEYTKFNIHSVNVYNFFENVVVYISMCLEGNDALNFEIYRVLDIQSVADFDVVSKFFVSFVKRTFSRVSKTFLAPSKRRIPTRDAENCSFSHRCSR